VNELEKRCIIEVFRGRYTRESKNEKGQILGELCEQLCVSRRYVLRLLRNKEVGRTKTTRKRRKDKK
jgi:excisionase family DNA binding protein